jgi:hypothetical protein
MATNPYQPPVTDESRDGRPWWVAMVIGCGQTVVILAAVVGMVAIGGWILRLFGIDVLWD